MSPAPGAPAPARRRPVAVLTVALLAALLSAVACGGPGAVTEGATAAVPVAAAAAPVLPVTIESDDGRPVTVRAADRIVVLDGGIAEIVVALGLAERVVGRDVSTTIDELDDRPLVTRAHDVSAESVLSLRPDVVLADGDTGPPEALDALRAAGVSVVVVATPSRVDAVAGRIRAVGAALGLAGAADALAASTGERIRAVTASPQGEPPSVAFLYLRGGAGVALLGGPGSGADSMVAAAGGSDAGTEAGLDRAFTPLTAEALVAADPDVLLLTTTGLASVGGIEGLVAMPGIAQTTAGRERRVVTMEDGLLYSFGIRTPTALEQLARDLQGREGA